MFIKLNKHKSKIVLRFAKNKKLKYTKSLFKLTFIIYIVVCKEIVVCKTLKQTLHITLFDTFFSCLISVYS